LVIATPQEKKTMTLSLNPDTIAAVNAANLTQIGVSYDNPVNIIPIQYAQPRPTRYQELLAELNEIVPPRGNTVVHNGRRVPSIYTQAEFDTIQGEVDSLVERANDRYELTPAQEAEIRRSVTRTQGLIALRNRGPVLIRLVYSVSSDTDLTLTENDRLVGIEIPARVAIIRENITTLEAQPGLQLRASDLKLRTPAESSIGNTASLSPSSYSVDPAELFELIPTAVRVVPVVKSEAIAA
jgi:hypothetical protein